MRKLGEAFYGRGKSYETAFAALPDTDALEALLTRTVYADAEVHPVRKLVDYILAQRAALADQPLERLLAGEVDWMPE
jgi:cytochrome b pre-mRNA-processing protein 3